MKIDKFRAQYDRVYQAEIEKQKKEAKQTKGKKHDNQAENNTAEQKK